MDPRNEISFTIIFVAIVILIVISHLRLKLIGSARFGGKVEEDKVEATELKTDKIEEDRVGERQSRSFS
jgi:hypothetical protein